MKNRIACSLLTWSLLAVAACGSSGSDGGGDGGTTGGPDAGDGGTGTCETTGTGTLTINVTGLPAGVNAKVTVTGPGGSQEVTATGPLTLPGGSYTVRADVVTASDPIVRPVYTPGVNPETVCVSDGATGSVEVGYQLVATSNKLWATSSNGSAELLGFSSSQLATSGSPTAEIAANVEIPGGVAFDKEGGMWITLGAAGNKTLAHYPAALFASGGAKTPDIVVSNAKLNPGVPGATLLAFDAKGNLWVSVVAGKSILKFDAASLTATGSPEPSVTISNVDGPGALAFDGAGNLWVSEMTTSKVLEFNASRLGASTSDPADVILAAQTPQPVVVNLQGPSGMAFDSANNLWVNYNGTTFARFTPAERAASATVTPAVQLHLAVDALADGVAFDESGGLWFAYAQGQIARLGPTQLGTTGDATPETILTSPSVGYGSSVALYPAPAALPVFGKVP